MQTILIIVLIASGLLGVTLMVGSRLPKTHVAASRIRLKAKPEEVWHILTDFRSYPSWRMGLKRVEVSSTPDNRPMWTEICAEASKIPFQVVEAEPPVWLVTQMANESLPLRGRWSYRLEEDSGETILTVTEVDRIHSPLFRFCIRYLLSYYSAMDVFLAELALKLGQPPAIEHLQLKSES
ncbi:MAG: SRPBCC family protein [Methylohalobius crimeensis]